MPTEQGPVLPHGGAAPGVQTPAWQVSAPLQELPSEQEVPSGAAVIPHAPVEGSHMLATWQASGAAQLAPLPGQEQTSGCCSVTCAVAVELLRIAVADLVVAVRAASGPVGFVTTGTGTGGL